METGSLSLRLYRLAFGAFFVALGVWMSARIILQLDAGHTSWPDWLILMFPALPLALGILALIAAVKNPPYRPRLLRERHGAARVFGSSFAGFYFISMLFRHLLRQTTWNGVVMELVAAAIVVGILALFFGAVNADTHDQQNPPASTE